MNCPLKDGYTTLILNSTLFRSQRWDHITIRLSDVGNKSHSSSEVAPPSPKLYLVAWNRQGNWTDCEVLLRLPTNTESTRYSTSTPTGVVFITLATNSYWFCRSFPQQHVPIGSGYAFKMARDRENEYYNLSVDHWNPSEIICQIWNTSPVC